MHRQDEDGITEVFYELMLKLKSIEKFLVTLNRFDILTSDEMRVIYHSSHAKCIEQMRET